MWNSLVLRLLVSSIKRRSYKYLDEELIYRC